MKRRWKHKWPTLAVPMPEDAIVQWLHYTDELITPRKGEWCHPEDEVRQKEIRAAVKVLLEWVT